MTRLEILTPSYAPDFDLCADLVASVRALAPPGTVHRIVVPTRDVEQFSALADELVTVESVTLYLPRSLLKVPMANIWVNARSPWPPTRGWIAQQLIKLAATAASSADHVLVVDSDVVFVRKFDVDEYTAGKAPVLYRVPDAVDARLPRHLVWDDVAHDLLGLARSTQPTRPDYICWPCLWDPTLVRSLLARVARVGGRPWQTVIGRQLHFSEMVLYGVYLDEIVAEEARISHVSSMRCVNYSDEETLDAAGMDRLLQQVGADDLAVMVSAKSNTSIAVRRAAVEDFLERLNGS
jgi:hypothetical protein